MVIVSRNVLLCCSLLLTLLPLCTGSSLLQSLISDVDPCEEVCQKTYPSHTYDKSLSGDCCLRGCRLYSIIELVGNENGPNNTLQSCFDNCHDAYPKEKEDSSACILGCNSQKPYTDKLCHITDQEVTGSDSEIGGMMFPFLYMHNMYSNMVDKVTHHMSVSWSLIMQDGTGRLVVIKSQPQMLDSDVQDFDDYTTFKGTNSMLETNIEISDNTATEVLRHSQLKSARSVGDDLGGDINAAQNYKLLHGDNTNSDWLSCIAKKTGIPRMLLCIIILLSAVAMIWLCMSAAVTAPDHRIAQQKLSIGADLDYLRQLGEKNGLKRVHPQDFVEARPLPVKIRVEQI